MSDRERISFPDLLIAVLALLLTAALYTSTRQERLYGNDAVFFCDWFALKDPGTYHHVLYLPAARLLARFIPDADPLQPLQLLSVVTAALGVGCTFLCCRALGARRWAACAATALLALTPALWFYATTIEVHALHFAVVTLAATVTLLAPWGRPGLALALTAPFFALTYLSHQSAPLLGPGWVLLVQCARARRHAPFRPLVLLAIGAALLGALVLGHMTSSLILGQGFAVQTGFTQETLRVWKQEFGVDQVWDLWLHPLWLLAPAALMGLVLARGARLRQATLLAFVVPPLATFLWWGITERGGYLLGTGAFWAALAALAPVAWARRETFAVLTLLALQALAGFSFVQSYDRGFRIEDRVAIVRESVGERGVLLSANDNAPNVLMYLPGVAEHNLRLEIGQGMSAEELALHVVAIAHAASAAGPVALERSYTMRADYPAAKSYMDVTERALEGTFRITPVEHPSWPLWLIEPR